MNQAVLVNKVRESSIQPTGAGCMACPTAGLPILPVRYAVVPNSLPGYALPASCDSPLLDKSDLEKVSIKQSKYVLRTLRPGFLYLYYLNPLTKAWTWQCYMVSALGLLREIPLSTKAPLFPSELPCTNPVHNIKSSIIALKNPEKITQAYIGYSEHFWSPKTRERYKKETKPRLVEFSPAAWMSSLKQANAVAAAEMEKCVLEYSAANFGRHLQSSYFDYNSRAGQATHLNARMEKINPGKGMILAIPDPIGCVSDLNSYRMHAVQELQRYLGEPEIAWKHSCSVQIEGLRKYVEEQTKEGLKDAKTTYVSAGDRRADGLLQITKEDKTAYETAKALKRLEEHYDEDKRKNFLKEYESKCAGFRKRILALDKDYVSWKMSATLALAIDDYEKSPGYSCGFATEVYARILAGGAISEASMESWEKMVLTDATDLRNYAIAGILLNQEEWQARFKNADEKNLVEHVWGDNKGKLFDISRYSIESNEFQVVDPNGGPPRNKIAEWAAELAVTSSSAIMAVIANKLQKAGEVIDDATQASITKLDQLQLKLGLAHGVLHAGTGIVLVQIELTVAQWHQIMSQQFRQSMQGVSREATQAFAKMALATQLRIPPNSAAGQKLISFTFWMHGTVQEIIKAANDAGLGIADGLAKAAKSAAQVVVSATGATGRAAAKTGQAIAGGAADGLRKVRVLAHSFPGGSVVLAQLHGQISANAAGRFALNAMSTSMRALSSTETKLASAAFLFQLYALRKSLNDFNSAVGFKKQDAAWAVASCAIGITSATVDLAGKGWKAIRPNASFTIIGARITADLAIKGAGFLSAGASAIDCIQSFIRANAKAKRGDMDAMKIQIGAGAVAAVAVYAGIKIALGSTALLGPVGLLVLCIGAGLLVAYLAFFAEDTAIGIWLDRCKFGNTERSEGPFRSRQQELDALELISRDISVELEWMDTPFSFDTDEVSILVRRLSGANDGIIMGLFVDGVAGKRQVFVRHQGLPEDIGLYRSSLPAKFAKAQVAYASNGVGFEAKTTRKRKGNVTVVRESEKQIIVWEEAAEINHRKFDRATVWIRYFPDKDNLYAFYEDELSVADDSNALRERNKQERLHNEGK